MKNVNQKSKVVNIQGSITFGIDMDIDLIEVREHSVGCFCETQDLKTQIYCLLKSRVTEDYAIESGSNFDIDGDYLNIEATDYVPLMMEL